MKLLSQLSSNRLAALAAACALFTVWLVFNFMSLVSTQNGFLRFFLGLLFATILLLRAKPEKPKLVLPGALLATAAVAGAVLVLAGIIVGVRQFEWLGLLLVIFGALAWALPANFTMDIILALLLFYWAHPLPGQVFAKLQFSMQTMSVSGAEWLLHMLNVRVWADGFVLKTGANIYEVPEWCSGMRTATTVFLLGLGLGLTKRLRWWETSVVIMAALVQALALNIVRLSVMVMLTPKMGGKEQGVQFLHDTAGLIVVLAAFIVLFEIRVWERYKHRRSSLGDELFRRHKKAFSEHPPFWRAAIEHKGKMAVFAVSIILLAGLVYKSRPYHRAEMMKEVASSLRDSGELEDAQRLADLIGQIVPQDENWHLTRTRMMLIRQKLQQVLDELRRIPESTIETTLEKRVLEAYSYMGLGRMEEAAKRVEELPEYIIRADPRVAMILSEMGMRANDPDEVARRIVLASKWNPNTRRVRALYPYLRAHRRWQAISDSDTRTPYADSASAFSATEAYMNLDKSPLVADLALKEMAIWPDDPRVLEPLFFMALKREGGAWEDRFTAQLARSAGKMSNPDNICELFAKCFQLARPDLAWFLYHRISELDPAHPGLPMSIAQYGDIWFTFRKQYLGMSAPQATDKIDIKPFFARQYSGASAPLATDKIDMKLFHILGTSFDSWQQLCAKIPAGSELLTNDTAKVRRQYLQKAIAEFKKRDAESPSGGLSLSMRYVYTRALEMANDPDAAHVQLERIIFEHPGEKERARVVLSEVYERKERWPEVYEVLRGVEDDPDANLTPLLRLCESQLRLRLGVAAIDTAMTTLRLFPNSTQAASIMGTALVTHDSAEEALFVTSKPRIRRERDMDVIEAECLFTTERFAELKTFCNSAHLPVIHVPRDTPQRISLLPAEAAALWHWFSIPTSRHFATNAVTLKRNLENAASPFLYNMIRLWLDCYEAKCGNGTDDAGKWLACGRDATEKAVALNQLTLLLCYHQKYAEARQVAGMAVSYLPQSAILWRILISLSGADIGVVEAARQACPEDSEIWLAELVIKTQRLQRGDRNPSASGSTPAISEPSTSAALPPHGDVATTNNQPAIEKWALAEIERAVASQAVTPAAMTRAGDYLLRGGIRKAASIAARDAVSRARGLLPAYVLGVKCALLDMDKPRALECTRGAIQSALRPPPLFYKKLVEIKTDKNKFEADNEMLEALRQLRAADPDNPTWTQMLGFVRFNRGGWEVVEAFQNMNAAIEAGATNRLAYVVAAEASRLVGNTERAVDFLRKGLERHPDDVNMINNLAYCLCFMPDGDKEALKLTPKLLHMESDTRVLDTVTLVYIRSGQLDEAEKTAAKMLQLSKEHTKNWFQAKIHQAEIAMGRGNRDEAAELLAAILRHTHNIPDEYIIAANTLLVKAISDGTESEEDRPRASRGRRSKIEDKP